MYLRHARHRCGGAFLTSLFCIYLYESIYQYYDINYQIVIQYCIFHIIFANIFPNIDNLLKYYIIKMH